MSKIVLVGGFPPPFGGISVHVQRLKEAASRVADVSVVDFYGPSVESCTPDVVRCGTLKPFNILKAVLYLFRSRPDVVHFHISAIGNFYVAGFPLLWACRYSKKLITIHSGSFSERFNSATFLKKALFKRLINSMQHVIVVNEPQRVIIEQLAVPIGKISVVPAFLPPVPTEATDLADDIAQLRVLSNVLVLVSGYALPYYGFHTVIEAVKALRERDQCVSVVFALYNQYDDSYLDLLTSQLEGLPHLLYKDLDPDQFSYLLSLVDIYVRPTDRDGDAVALREAAFFNKQVIASDCVERPAGTEIFKTMDSSSLTCALGRVINDDNLGRIFFNFDSGKRQLMDIYRNLMTPQNQ